MANIVFIFHDFWGCKRGNEYIYPAFHHGLIEELRNNGNNVYCYVKPITAKAYDFSGQINKELLDELKGLNPDLFIIINNRFWDISDYFDCPIICYSVDSPSLLSNLELLKKKKDRFKFVVQQSIEVDLIKSIIGADRKNIEYILSTTPIQNTYQPKDKNISFLGSQWLWEGLADLVDYMKRNPSREDSIFAKEIHNKLINIEAKTYDEIIEEIYKEHPNYPEPKLIVKDQDIYISRLSGIRRARYLAKIADLGLEIYGDGWATSCMAYFPDLALNWISSRVITASETEELFNTSKLCFQLNHIQAKTGFSWKIPDIMASGGCLVTNSTLDFKRLFGNNIPTFESDVEARELCAKLLKNPNMREDIVAYSNQKVEELFRPRRAIEQLENLSLIKLIKNNTKRGEFKIQMYKLFEEKKAPTKLISINQTPNNKFSIKFANITLYKIKRKNINESNIYVLGVPLFKMLQNSKGYNFNLLFLSNLYRLYAKQKDKLKQFKIQRQNIKSKQEICKKFKDGKKINICIQVSRPGMWCFDYLYKLLEKDPRFNVSILIMPDHNYKREIHQFYLEKTYKELCQKGYKPIKGYDFDLEKSVDIRGVINPDIIFYTDFWKPHFYDGYYITSFLDKITLLNEYGFSVMQDEMTCNFELNNLVDMYFRPTEIHKQMAQQLMKNKGRNVIVTGSPKLDALFDAKYKPMDVWKKQKGQIHKKRIIWAPHYNDKTPSKMYQNDAFWEIYDFMLEIADKYKDKVQFVFRPHPVLKKRASERWGEEEQEAYYHKWDTLSNGQYYDGDFVDLFMKSDAMLTDSCSFRAEYTAFNKPLFITKTQTSRSNYNDFGQKLNELFYIPSSDLKQGIIDFIEDVVLRGNDYKKAERTEFVKKYFGKINGKTASENIYDEIIKFLEKGKIA